VRVEGEEKELTETTQERHAMLVTLVKEKRQEKGIRAVELELAGKGPAHPVVIEGTTPVPSNRAASPGCHCEQ
jgi:hypothetical protein